ncbi:MAG TPA: endonuclease/exonuclease/phosphatase family protein [Candidatus Syntrophosphaera thermopropionivorans]|jgi:endonuclease/exonuclease/phosphatase family metal-dependent hydrolase|nr:endonuclease/exonuclease/phosphatase family protein [Candidatus Syntrophosphaera thermopropionivorans]HPX63546.1 endonuclease/exonuclease/phosphatase family protein [Candidatus Syntrophosphaera thermopropionivorans]
MRYIKKLTLLLMLTIFLLFSCGTNHKLTPPENVNILEFGTESTLEVVTWNLKTFPLNNNTVQTISQIIPQFKVDIIACQEVMDQNAFYQLASAIPQYEALVSNATSSYRLAYLYNKETVQVNEVYPIFIGESNPFPRPPYVLDFNYKGLNFICINNHLKALGDDYIDESDAWDEEVRRRLACQKLDQYITEHFPDRRVIVVGDMNDQIAEPPSTNVFQVFLDKPDEYYFTDYPIALNPTYDNVSYPHYSPPSHLDHILITNELFDAFAQADSVCRVIKVEDYMGSWSTYSSIISDHRPLGVRLYFSR